MTVHPRRILSDHPLQINEPLFTKDGKLGDQFKGMPFRFISEISLYISGNMSLSLNLALNQMELIYYLPGLFKYEIFVNIEIDKDSAFHHHFHARNILKGGHSNYLFFVN